MVNPEITDNGDKFWRNEQGQYHREDGPAIELISGTKCWYINGLRHRKDGPAIELISGTKFWYINGLRHREDGPAFEWLDGDKDWYINGVEYTEEEYRMNQFMKGIKVNG